MIIEIDYEIIPNEEFEEIKENCTRLMTEILMDLYKAKHSRLALARAEVQIKNLKEQNDLKE